VGEWDNDLVRLIGRSGEAVDALERCAVALERIAEAWERASGQRHQDNGGVGVPAAEWPTGQHAVAMPSVMGMAGVHELAERAAAIAADVVEQAGEVALADPVLVGESSEETLDALEARHREREQIGVPEQPEEPALAEEAEPSQRCDLCGAVTQDEERFDGGECGADLGHGRVCQGRFG
jgi:hypothetical protein